MLDIFYDISATLPYLKALAPLEYTLGYTHNMSYSDSFRVGYEARLQNWDVHTSIMWSMLNGKYTSELMFCSMKSSPSLGMDRVGGENVVISAMRHITGIENLAEHIVEDMHTVREISASCVFYRNYPINKSSSLYIGSGMGIAKILRYQGFRSSAEDLYGVIKRVKIGVSHKLNTSLTAYMGYSYRKYVLKYKSDIIYDAEGNSVKHGLFDFEFSSHGMELGLRFLSS